MIDKGTFAFSSYLDKELQLIKPYNNKYSNFVKGEIVKIRSYELLGENRDKGVFVTTDGRVILDSAIKDISAIFNPMNPAVPITKKETITNNIVSDPYKMTKQKNNFKLDENNNEDVQIIPDKQTETKPIEPTITKSQSSSIFDTFKSEQINFTLKMILPLPKISLLKNMYQLSADKDVFLDDLSKFILKHITLDAIKQSLLLLLEKRKK